MKRWLWRGGVTLGVLALLIVAFYVEENWRGARLWAQTKAEYEAKGFNFDPKSLIPPPVPDEQNFAKSEIWLHILASRDPKKEVRPTSTLLDLKKPLQEWKSNNKTWRNWLLGQEQIAPSLSLFTPAQKELNQLVEAAEQSASCQFSVDFNSDALPAAMPLPELGPAMTVTQLLQAHSLAALKTEDSNTAIRDLSTICKLSMGIGQQPTLISGLVAASIAQMPLPVIWDGIESHHWSESDLSKIQSLLGSIALLKDYDRAIRGELNFFFLGSMDWFIKHRSPRYAQCVDLSGVASESKQYRLSPLAILLTLSPSGWYDETKAIGTPDYIDRFLGAIDFQKKRFYPEKELSQSELLARKSYQPVRFFWLSSVASVNTSSYRFAQAQTMLDLAQVACGLERYWLANKNYPATLAELEPQYIAKVPHDLCTGEPLHYRVNADGNYSLYSVGFNGVDDGGQIVMKKESTTAIDPKQGDWVWPRSKK